MSSPSDAGAALRPTVAATPLSALTAALGVPGPRQGGDAQVTGVSHSSSGVLPGDLYVAVAGARTHGARFAGEAADRGAVAVLTDSEGSALARDSGLPTVICADPRSLLGPLAAAVYGNPAQQLAIVGVTGTNGKTTVTTLLHAVLTAAFGSAGLVGTIETRIGADVVPSVRTTPEASDLQALLAVMVQRGVRAAAIEVSSHAIALGRVGGLVVDAAGFTNLSQDHLDFHADMDDYFATKARLFTPDHAHRGTVVVDDGWGRRLARQATVPVQTLTTVTHERGLTRASDDATDRADWVVDDIDLGAQHSAAGLRGPDGRSHELRVPLPGLVNVANGALTVAMATQVGVDAGAATASLADAPMVAGRMERVSGEGSPLVVVDYAHSPDALERALSTLRVGSPAPVVVVIGAGGDRDRSKRAPMGAVAARGADMVVVTDDNPRSERASDIRAAVLDGARSVDPSRVVEVPDRREAIRRAIELAGAGTVLVAGKGHEQGQEVDGVVHAFDDRVEARAALAKAAAPAQPTASTVGEAP